MLLQTIALLQASKVIHAVVHRPMVIIAQGAVDTFALAIARMIWVPGILTEHVGVQLSVMTEAVLSTLSAVIVGVLDHTIVDVSNNLLLNAIPEKFTICLISCLWFTFDEKMRREKQAVMCESLEKDS